MPHQPETSSVICKSRTTLLLRGFADPPCTRDRQIEFRIINIWLCRMIEARPLCQSVFRAATKERTACQRAGIAVINLFRQSPNYSTRTPGVVIGLTNRNGPGDLREMSTWERSFPVQEKPAC